MAPESDGGNEYRVLLLPPTRRDGEVTCTLLEVAGITSLVSQDPAAFAEQVKAGVGAIVLTDAIVAAASIAQLAAALDDQPSWSDVPTILLSRTEQSASTARLLGTLRNVTVLERPTSRRTLVSAIEAALRARRRQYQIRDQLNTLRQVEESLRTADRRKDEFLAMLAHELRNPLAVIRTATELLARTLPPEARAQTGAELVKRQALHLTRMVDDLMDVSRITQGRIQLQRRPLALSTIVAQAIESVEPLLRQKRHTVSRIANLEPLYVNGDSARLLQCVTNLITNAAKYTDPSGHIRVELRGTPEVASILVSDNGIGIAPELLPSIFDLFVQSGRSLDRSEGGLGIGLSVVQRLVRMHGGEVRAASAGPGKGSTFEIRLSRVPPPPEPASQNPAPTINPKRILVVDDNADAANSLVELLRLDGHEADAVYSANAALHAVETNNPDVVLLDIGLPEMDGYQVAQQVRKNSSGIRLIALTGYGQAADIVRTSAAGFDAHMVKPVDFDVLQRAIAAIHTGRRAEPEASTLRPA
jgi:signal transduction histidine kinase/ActR/RegA family two-component response regulator